MCGGASATIDYIPASLWTWYWLVVCSRSSNDSWYILSALDSMWFRKLMSLETCWKPKGMGKETPEIGVSTVLFGCFPRYAQMHRASSLHPKPSTVFPRTTVGLCWYWFWFLVFRLLTATLTCVCFIQLRLAKPATIPRSSHIERYIILCRRSLSYNFDWMQSGKSEAK